MSRFTSLIPRAVTRGWALAGGVAAAAIVPVLIDFTAMNALPTNSFAFTRASTATYYDSNGVMQTAAANVPRFDYDPATLQPRGLLIEEARTNSLRNSTMQGGAVGTLPTYWGIAGRPNITSSVVGVGTENGVPYIDIRVFGTPTDTGAFQFVMGSQQEAAALQTQVWTYSATVRVVAGSMANLGLFQAQINEYGSSNNYLAGGMGPTVSLTNTDQLLSYTRTLTNASTAGISPLINTSVTIGSTIDFTIRIKRTQLEQGVGTSSFIPTSLAVATRAVDTLQLSGATLAYLQGPQWSVVEEAVFNAYPAVDGPLLIDTAAPNDSLMYVGAGTGTVKSYQTAAAAALSTAGSFTAGSVFRVGVSSSATGRSLVRDNGVVVTDANALLPSSTVTLGSKGSSWRRRIAFYPTRMVDGDLQQRTVLNYQLP